MFGIIHSIFCLTVAIKDKIKNSYEDSKNKKNFYLKESNSYINHEGKEINIITGRQQFTYFDLNGDKVTTNKKGKVLINYDKTQAKKQYDEYIKKYPNSIIVPMQYDNKIHDGEEVIGKRYLYKPQNRIIVKRHTGAILGNAVYYIDANTKRFICWQENEEKKVLGIIKKYKHNKAMSKIIIQALNSVVNGNNAYNMNRVHEKEGL